MMLFLTLQDVLRTSIAGRTEWRGGSINRLTVKRFPGRPRSDLEAQDDFEFTTRWTDKKLVADERTNMGIAG